MKALTSLCLVLFAASALLAQGQITIPPPQVRTDSISILGALKEPLRAPEAAPASSAGVDLLVSNGGFGLGGFYRHDYSEDYAGFIDLSISEAKDDEEKDFIDYYGRRITPGKVNRFLVVPLFVGLERRLFREDIVENFRPYVSAAVGPALLYVFPADLEYFNALGVGHAAYTAGGYVGVGAYFGSERSSIMGLNLRYYYVPYPAGIESMVGIDKKEFGGFYIAINFGSAW